MITLSSANTPCPQPARARPCVQCTVYTELYCTLPYCAFTILQAYNPITPTVAQKILLYHKIQITTVAMYYKNGNSIFTQFPFCLPPLSLLSELSPWPGCVGAAVVILPAPARKESYLPAADTAHPNCHPATPHSPLMPSNVRCN